MKFDFKNIAFLAFCAFAIKLLILQDISAFQAVSFFIAALFVAFYEYKASVSQLKEQQEQIDVLNKEIATLKTVQTDIITNLSSVKLMQNIKSQNNRQY